MIDLDLARALHDAGLVWEPAKGDRFAVPDRDMDDDVFVVSDLVIEVREAGGRQLLAFNGTTEWALDSLELDEALWLPREEQLRELLGDAFAALERVSEPVAAFVVRTTAGVHVGITAEEAYARALLVALTG